MYDFKVSLTAANQIKYCYSNNLLRKQAAAVNMSLHFKNIYNKRFHALTHKDFRIYWLGQCISLMGTWMQNIGLTWLVYSVTGSPVLLGLLETVRFLPITLFSLFAGVIIDKYPKRKILLITQTVAMILAFILSAMAFTHMVKYEYILVLALILGIVNTMDGPARQTFTVEMTGKEDLVNAIALSSVTFNMARIIGPTIGAIVLAYLGPGWCFLLNGLSFIAVIISLLRIKVRPYVKEKQKRGNILAEIIDGLKYITRERMLFQPIVLIIITGIFVYNYDILLPVLTKNILHQNEKIYGVLMSSLGIGSLLGALMVSAKIKFNTGIMVLILSSLVEAMMLIFIGFSKVYYLTIVFLIISAVFNIWFGTTASSLLQLNSKDEYRGRVMSVYSLVYSGTAPIGYMFAGAAANRFGADTTFLISGILTIALIILLTLIFRVNRKV